MPGGASYKDAIVLDSDESGDESQVEVKGKQAANQSTNQQAQLNNAARSNSNTIKNAPDVICVESSPAPDPHLPPSTSASAAAGPGPSIPAFSKEERARMEAERRERNRKRRRDQGLPVSEDEVDDGKPQWKRRHPGHRLDGERVPYPEQQEEYRDAQVNIGVSSVTQRSPADLPPPRRWSHTAAGKRPESTSTSTPAHQANGTPLTSTVSNSCYEPIKSTDRFWQGVLKYTNNDLFTPTPPSHKGVTFDSLFLPATRHAPNGLKQAIMCTYCCEPEFVFGSLPIGQPVSRGGSYPDLLLITDPGRASNGKRALEPGVQRPSATTPNVSILVPEGLTSWGVQHMKFLVLVHETHLRFVLSTGNFQSCDWEFIENVIWIQDFPLKKPAASSSTDERPNSGKKMGDFEEQLRFVLGSLNVPGGHPIYKDLGRFDLANDTIYLVASVPITISAKGTGQQPKLAQEDIGGAGIGRLSKLIRQSGLKPRPVPSLSPFPNRSTSKEGPTPPMLLEAQGSSCGSYDVAWLKNFYTIASGHEIIKNLHVNESGKQKGNTAASWPKNIKIHFPSERFVKQNYILGPGGAGTFFGKKAHFLKNEYGDLFYEPQSKRGDLLMHAKSLLALPLTEATLASSSSTSASSDDPNEVIGWSYMGSHNFTKAAWGGFSGQPSKWSYTCSNYELGMFFPIRRRDLSLAPNQQPPGLQCIPYKRPSIAYRQDDVPWDQFAQGQ